MGFTQVIESDIGFFAEVDIPTFDEELYLGDDPELRDLVNSIGDDRMALEEEIGNVGLTEAEITRPAGIGGSEAEVKVIVDDPEPFKIATLPGISVDMYVNIYDERVFTGEIIKVTQNHEGVLTLIAQDARRDLLTYTVRLDTPGKGIPSTKLIRNLLIEDGPFDEANVSIGFGGNQEPDRGEGHLISRQGDAFSGFDYPVNVRLNVGHDYQPTLYQVVKSIAKEQHAYAYIDKYNRFHFKPLPERMAWEPELITEFNAGDNSDDTDQTIVEAPRADLLGGTFGHQYINSESVTASAEKTSGNSSRRTRIRDQNLQSVESANNVAVDNQLLNSLSTHSGEFTVVGHPTPIPFAQVRLNDLPEWAPLPEDTYTITEITHRINASDGYLTDVSVGQDLASVYESIVDNGKSDDLAEAVSPSAYDDWIDSFHPPNSTLSTEAMGYQ